MDPAKKAAVVGRPGEGRLRLALRAGDLDDAPEAHSGASRRRRTRRGRLPSTRTTRDPLLLFKRGLEALAQDKFLDAQRWLLAGIEANTSNEPLNRDMRLVLDRMAHAGVLQEASAAAPAAPPAAAETADHFLVSSYGRKP